MTKLIALVDGSVYSRSVCEHTAWLANRLEYPVEILHVLSRRDLSGEPADLSGSIGLGARSALLTELAELDAQTAKLAQKRGRAILIDAESLLNDNGVTQVETRLRNGEILETLQETENAAEIIVIGKRGESADFATLHLGSNLERVVRATTKPILVASRSFKPIKRVLIAFDGGKSAISAVNYLSTSNQFLDLDIHLLYVGEASNPMQRQLEGAVATLNAAGFNTSSEFLAGQADKIIAEQVDTLGFDLLLMGAYGHSRIRNLIIGSTTTEMIRSCKIPILLWR